MHSASLWRFSHLRFESYVVLDGNQTVKDLVQHVLKFESCVVLDGNQTGGAHTGRDGWFESCVVLDGNQTAPPAPARCIHV